MVGATTIESAWACWYGYFSSSVSRFVPMRPLFLGKTRNGKPWYTAKHRLACRKKDRLFRRARRSGAVQDWVAYKMFRNMHYSNLRRDKTSYLTEIGNRMNDERNAYNWWRQAKQSGKHY